MIKFCRHQCPLLTRGISQKKETVSVEIALRKFFSQETIHSSGERQTSSAVTANKYSLIEHLPRLLILQLKRFSLEASPITASAASSTATAQTGFDVLLSKNKKFVEYPLVLPIDPSLLVSPAPALSLSALCFRLRSVISHHGTSISQGHYTADIFFADLDCWMNANDESLTFVSELEVLSRHNAYLLVYEQV